jgi:hypothetical protein
MVRKAPLSTAESKDRSIDKIESRQKRWQWAKNNRINGKKNRNTGSSLPQVFSPWLD